jgi:ribosome-binding factor A
MEKVADLLQSEVAELLRREVKHPALQDAMISITRVEVTPDLAWAHLHVSLMGDDERREGQIFAALAQSEAFMHRLLVKRLHMRMVPRLVFHPDHSIAEGARMTELMREVAHNEGRDL